MIMKLYFTVYFVQSTINTFQVVIDQKLRWYYPQNLTRRNIELWPDSAPRRQLPDVRGDGEADVGHAARRRVLAHGHHQRRLRALVAQRAHQVLVLGGEYREETAS